MTILRQSIVAGALAFGLIGPAYAQQTTDTVPPASAPQATGSQATGSQAPAAGTPAPAAGAPAAATAPQATTDGYQTGMIPSPHIYTPADPKTLTAMVFLVSNSAGWGQAEETEAQALVKQGAAVVGIDYPSYIHSLHADDGDCIYTISDIEDLSQQVQRRLGNANYHHPILAGIGDGGALVLGMIAQSPPVTVGGAIVVDPTAGIPLQKELCTPATKTPDGDRIIYGLTDGALPASVTVAFTPSVDAPGKQHVQDLLKDHPDIDTETVTTDANATLADLLSDQLSKKVPASDQPLDLPLTILDTKPTMNTMAVIYSGDGGWRDIDSDVGTYLQSQGMPVVGVDSLRYFWHERKAQETADDMAKIIETYRRKWGVQNVVLIGYSFGADILPASYNLLPRSIKAHVRQMSLLAFSKEVDFEISVTGWLGVAGEGKGGNTLNDIAKIDPKVVQCMYGTDEDDDPCPTLKDKGVETVAIDGGHHFDEDYEALGKRILDSLKGRLSR